MCSVLNRLLNRQGSAVPDLYSPSKAVDVMSPGRKLSGIPQVLQGQERGELEG